MFSHRSSIAIDEPMLPRSEALSSLVNNFVFLPMNLLGPLTEKQEQRQRQIYERTLIEALAVVRPSRPQRLFSEIRN